MMLILETKAEATQRKYLNTLRPITIQKDAFRS